jgi:hypothetical protein
LDNNYENSITFHIRNEAYAVNLGNDIDAPILKKELLKFMPEDENVDIKDLLTAYIRKSQEFIQYKKQIQEISLKLPDV